MIIAHGFPLYSSSLIYGAYAKAQREINRFSKNPSGLTEYIPFSTDVDQTYSFYLSALSRLFYSVQRQGEPGADFRESFEDARNDIMASTQLDCVLLFHFDALLEYENYFSGVEYREWKERYQSLFREHEIAFMMPLHTVYKDVKRQFYTSPDWYNERFDEEISVSYITYIDFCEHRTSYFNAEQLGAFVNFAYAYHDFYDAFETFLEKRILFIQEQGGIGHAKF